MTTLPIRGLDSQGNYIFLPYDPKAPITEAGKRTIKIMYKVAKTGANAGIVKGANSCLLVAPLKVSDVEENVEALKLHVLAMLEAEQDKIAKGFHLAGSSLVSPSNLTVVEIIKSLEAERESGRMNKEILTDWFTETLADNLMLLFAGKLGVSEVPTVEESKKVERFVDVYKNKFCGLASNLVTYQKDEAEKLLIAMEKCEVDFVNDSIAGKVKEKLERMIKPVNVEELLGF